MRAPERTRVHLCAFVRVRNKSCGVLRKQKHLDVHQINIEWELTFRSSVTDRSLCALGSLVSVASVDTILTVCSNVTEIALETLGAVAAGGAKVTLLAACSGHTGVSVGAGSALVALCGRRSCVASVRA